MIFKFAYVIINLKKHNLAKSRNFWSLKLKVGAERPLALPWAKQW